MSKYDSEIQRYKRGKYVNRPAPRESKKKGEKQNSSTMVGDASRA